MNNSFFESLILPPVYTKSNAEFWNDGYISKQMLKAHLDPEFDGASRRLEFIKQSAAWINELVPPSEYPSLLDVGCGPGIYAEKFAEAGYHVTGIDFSKRSIDFAKQSAMDKNLDIHYLYQNYLNMDLMDRFDLSVMIYCDYGVLSPDERQAILGKIFHHLNPGGKLLLDVFSMNKFNNFKEQQIWEFCCNGGFWRPDEYAALSGFYKYPDYVTLDLITIVSKDEIVPYYLWNTYFSGKRLIKEAEKTGFKVCGIYSDVTGKSYQSDSDTIAVLLEK
ncbi:class I SAM-dependent methyltransferase [Qiania dongpingensis]|uniref:Methyltransferase domain-containing protein n=1 Tax=Qiania dongpingensis TaxID=2763669 RepID=A0A7G9G3G8_9FIRM|nr:class I SAM-dependent methyltransferase [Qiania dongpingensis]QNM05350.1 methyltransferase domain-containing protein [Qiania dongpingensis]